MRGRAVGAALISAVLLIASAPSASATEGSVPAVVTAYITTDLVDDLNEFYGESANGAGLEFDESTTFSPADRIFAFTDDEKTDVEPLNEWETRVTISKQLIGLAIVTIDARTSEPQLASFEKSADLATALNDLPAEGALVRDSVHNAWLLVDGDTSTALFSGTVAEEPVSTAAFPTPLIGLGVGLLIVILVVALEIFMPTWRGRGRRRQPKAPDLS